MIDARFATLRRFAGRRVLVAGDVMLDEYIWGTVTRISPEAPVPIVEVETVTLTPGGAANVAVNLKSLGADPVLVGLVGPDDTATRLRQALVERGIDGAILVADPERPTTLKTRIVAHGQQMVRTDRESRRPAGDPVSERCRQAILDNLATVDAVILSDYGKGLLTDNLTGAVITAGRQRDLPVAVDPKGLHYAKYRRAGIVTPNALEAGRAAHLDIHNEAELLEAGRRLLTDLDTDAILITRGGEGMSLFEPGERVQHLSASAREVFDVTGAGDTVIATLTLALAAGADYRTAAELANRAAGVVVGKVGTAGVTVDELERELHAAIV